MCDDLKRRHAKAVSESSRERETIAYVESILHAFERNDDGKPLPSNQLRTSPDPLLTSLAQLASHRTGTARSMISIFDKEHQYIVAESTATTTLAPGLPAKDAEADLWLCGTAIPRNQGVCDFTVREAEQGGNIRFYPEGNGRGALLPLTKVEDLSLDSNFCMKPYCQPGSPAKFYAAVPIRTAKRINIGVICVIHDEPVTWWNDDHAQVLRDLSRIIMDHWDATSSRMAHRRAERMNRGMGSFLEDKSTLSGWRDGPFSEAYYERKGSEGNLNREQQASEMKADKALQHRSGMRSILDTEPLPPSTPQGQEAQDEDRWSSSHLVQSHSSDLEGSASAPAKHRIQAPTDPADQSQKRQDDIDRVFDKAANLVRESLEVEGCLFLDPTLTTFGSLVGSAGQNPSPMTTVSEQSSGECDDKGASDGEAPLQYCRILGFSTSTSHSVNGDTPFEFEGTIAQKLTAVLLQRYPQGKIFNFDSNGDLMTSDSSDDSTPTNPRTPDTAISETALSSLAPTATSAGRRRKRWSREQEGKNISDIFPGARSVAFMPIWDSRKESWFAASFTYTNSPARAFTVQGELTYLKAFGMLAMENILRLETMHADKAKSDALSCISHELRSPLHGILLGVELLNDTDLNVVQGNMVHSLETCCRTMLDTVDHLLDFSNINNITRQNRWFTPAQGVQSTRTRQPGLTDTNSMVTLPKLAEEVIDSVFAGFQFQDMSIKQFARRQKESHSDVAAHAYMDGMHAHDEFGGPFSAEPESFESADASRTTVCNNGVQVFLTVDPGCEWSFYANSGALRRIIMNLFGNSLKYTEKGMIKVSLSQKTLKTASRRSTRQVLLTVADTGIGMSQDYQQNHLFRPFAQENSLSPGTGLGLSLVRQLVSQMRGKISVDSRVGVGTTISVSLPLKMSAGSAASPDNALTDKFPEKAKSLRGLRIRLLGFSGDGAAGDNRGPTGDLSDAMSTMCRICTEWLGLDVISEADAGNLLPDLILTSADAYSTSVRDSDLAKAPTLVICHNALAAYQQFQAQTAVLDKSRLVEFVSQPIGPHKLTRALSLLVDRWRHFQDYRAADRPALSRSFSLAAESPVAEYDAYVAESEEKHPLAKGNSPASARSHTPPPTPSKTDLSDHLEAKSGNSTETVPSPEPQKQVELAAGGATESSLPLRPAASSTTSPTVSHETSFLLVDDNAINLKILKTYMTKLKCSFEGAMNGQEALDVFKTMSASRKCVLMDISMPVMDGLEATRRIRLFESSKKLEPAVIIALTGLGSQATQQAAFSSGVDLFLTKPVQLKELGNILTLKGLMPSQKVHA